MDMSRDMAGNVLLHLTNTGQGTRAAALVIAHGVHETGRQLGVP